MKNRLFNHKIELLFFLFCLSFESLILAWPPINLFRPSDRLLQTEPIPGQFFEFTLGVEHAFKVKGFRETVEICQPIIDCTRTRSSEVNPLQIYGKKQNVVAALKGFEPGSNVDLLAQSFFADDESNLTLFLRPTGCFEIPYNVLLSARLYFDYGISLGAFLPFYKMRLSNVRWASKSLSPSDPGLSQKKLEDLACRVGNLSLNGWERSGPGDLIIQARWMQDYIQINKPLLQNVRPQTRLGVILPTGEKRAENKILAFAFGNDGSWGIQFAGGLDLFFYPSIRVGLDAEFDYFFGNIRPRRIKTDCNQSDLLLFTKVPVFREYGLFQHFTVFIQGYWPYVSPRLAYQYYKQNENKDFPCSDRINPSITNNFSESQQDWTTHSLIASVNLDLAPILPARCPKPELMGWLKWGFNGKRALLADTFGFTLSMKF